MTKFRFAALSVLALSAILGLVLTANTGAHPGHPEKKLFNGRWYQQVVGGDYDTWMTLSTSDVWLDCDGAPAACGAKWINPFDGAMADWNVQDTTVFFEYFEGEQDINNDVNVFIEDTVLGDPSLLGISLHYDINGDPCDPDACTYYYNDVIVGDNAHAGPFGTLAERQGTIAHELGHTINLRHESTNADESVLYECGMDDTGPIPHSVMSYNCIDPISVGGFGETYVQAWDVCGVNHAYFDPGFGFAGCPVIETPTPTPTESPTPTPTPSPTATATPTPTPTPTHTGTPSTSPTATATATATPTPTPTATPEPAGIAGDVDCSGSVNSVDALKILRHVAALSVAQNEPCVDIGGNLDGSGGIQGDVDCSGGVNSVDALKVLRHVAALSVAQNEPCPDIGGG